jgi:plasmid stability protein
MAQLLVNDITPGIVRALHARAARHGVSAEEEHRLILEEALSTEHENGTSLMEFLLSAENPWPDDFAPARNKAVNPVRRVSL